MRDERWKDKRGRRCVLCGAVACAGFVGERCQEAVGCVMVESTRRLRCCLCRYVLEMEKWWISRSKEVAYSQVLLAFVRGGRLRHGRMMVGERHWMGGSEVGGGV